MGVGFDPPEDNAAWAADQGFPFELWTDSDRQLAVHFGAAASADARRPSRRTVLLDAQGNLALLYDVGITGLGTHPADVLADAKALFPKPQPAPAAPQPPASPEAEGPETP